MLTENMCTTQNNDRATRAGSKTFFSLFREECLGSVPIGTPIEKSYDDQAFREQIDDYSQRHWTVPSIWTSIRVHLSRQEMEQFVKKPVQDESAPRT